MAFVILATVVLRGFLSRITVLLGLVFGFVLSWVFDRLFGMTPTPQEDGSVKDAFRVDLSGVADAPWFGLPEFHTPEFHLSAILVALPAVIALIAENAGHVKAVQGDDRQRPQPLHGSGDLRRRCGHSWRPRWRRTHHDLRRKHRGYGDHPSTPPPPTMWLQ